MKFREVRKHDDVQGQHFVKSESITFRAGSSQMTKTHTGDTGYLRYITILKGNMNIGGRSNSLANILEQDRKGGYSYISPYLKEKTRLRKKGIISPGKKDEWGEEPFAGAYKCLNKGKDRARGSHDVVTALFLSQFIYYLGEIRRRTRKLGFGRGDPERDIIVAEFLTGFPGETGDNCHSVAKLMRGNLQLESRSGLKKPPPPSINMEQIEYVLNDDRFKGVSKTCACELAVLAFRAFTHRSLYLYKFDAASAQNNLVYAIAAQDAVESDGSKVSELFVIFRGSVTVTDWFQNLQAPLVDIYLRADKISGKFYLVEQFSNKKVELEKELHDLMVEAIGDTVPIRVHKGFLGYLFGTRKNDAAEKMEGATETNKDGRICKYESIVNDLRLLFDGEKEIAALYVTGHSLGAALATLASFFLACDLEVKTHNQKNSFQGFMCITFASPLVGNVSFQRAFDVLQLYQKKKMGTKYNKDDTVRLRHIRFTNDRDLVPLSPPLLRYRHTACIHIHLHHVSPWSPYSWSTIVEQKPLRQMFSFDKKDKMRHLTIFPPSSTLSGLWETSIPFLFTVLSTAPIVLIFLWLLIKTLLRLLSPFEGSLTNFIEAMPLSTQQQVEVSWGRIKNEIPYKLIICLPWLLWLMIGAWPNATVPRTSLLIAALPVLSIWTLEIANKDYYLYLDKYSESLFLVGIILLQILLIPIRRADQVLSAETHSLAEYFAPICKDYKRMSSSKKILGTAPKKASTKWMKNKISPMSSEEMSISTKKLSERV